MRFFFFFLSFFLGGGEGGKGAVLVFVGPRFTSYCNVFVDVAYLCAPFLQHEFSGGSDNCRGRDFFCIT